MQFNTLQTKLVQFLCPSSSPVGEEERKVMRAFLLPKSPHGSGRPSPTPLPQERGENLTLI